MVVQGIPRLLGGRYELGQKVGSGGMAVVLDAVDRTLGRRVAVKVLFPHLVGDQPFVERFRQEARSAARLSHPNVVAIFDVGSHRDADSGEIEFIVMEFVEGRALRQELEAGPMPPAQAATVAREMCAGLQAAHAGGLVHRDVKPANVMLGSSGQVKVTDFGVARALDAARLTQTGMVIATAQYASPEQLQGQDVDARSDVYSLGCCLYEMLAGTPPFADGDPVSVAFRQVHEAPMLLRQRNPLIPAGLAAVAARAIEKEPGQRYQSAAEMAADLSLALAGEQPAAVRIAGRPAPATEVTTGASATGASATGASADTAPIEVAGWGGPVFADAPDSRPETPEPVRSRFRHRLLAGAGVLTAFGLGAGLAVQLLGWKPAAPTVPAVSPSAPVTTSGSAPATAHTRPTNRTAPPPQPTSVNRPPYQRRTSVNMSTAPPRPSAEATTTPSISTAPPTPADTTSPTDTTSPPATTPPADPGQASDPPPAAQISP